MRQGGCVLVMMSGRGRKRQRAGVGRVGRGETIVLCSPEFSVGLQLKDQHHLEDDMRKGEDRKGISVYGPHWCT